MSRKQNKENFQIDIQNVRDGYTLSGIDPHTLKNFDISSIIAFDEYFSYIPLRCLAKAKINDNEINKQAKEMMLFSTPEFLDEPDNQRVECSIFALILYDRLASQARDNISGWKAIKDVLRLNEMMIYVEGNDYFLRMNAINSANKRHEENRAQKTEAVKFYQENKTRFETRIAAAREIANKVIPGTTERTIDGWLRESDRTTKI
ncbi:MAG: hypothetical protein ACJAW1_003392 [Glaciecola sp.]|jgi:hypothetical protein